MADASTTTTVAYIYKRRYSDRQATEVATREHPTYYAIAKESAFDGAGFYYPVTYGNPQGVSATFSDAQANAAALKGVQFAATPVTKYGVITLDGPSMMRARGNKGAFYDFVTRHTDGILEQLGDDLAFDLFRDGNGQRGRRSSISSNTVTLTNTREVENFKVGMTVVASANSNGSSPRSGATTVTALSRSAGTITLDSAAAITSFSDNDYLFRDGDQNGACMDGMEDCTPLSAPTSGDSFRGVDRSVNVEALAGSRIDNTALYPEEVAGDLAVEVSIIGKKVSRGAVYPTVFQSIVKRLGAKVEYTNPGGSADIGFESLMIHTAAGAVKLVSDPDIPTNRIRLWRPDAHCIKHIDEIVHIIRDDGRPSMRGTSTDGIEIRARHLGNYIQYDTASHGVGSVA